MRQRKSLAASMAMAKGNARNRKFYAKAGGAKVAAGAMTTPGIMTALCSSYHARIGSYAILYMHQAPMPMHNRGINKQVEAAERAKVNH